MLWDEPSRCWLWNNWVLINSKILTFFKSLCWIYQLYIFSAQRPWEFFFFPFQVHRQHMKFPGQGSDLSWGFNLCHSYGNTGSLTYCARLGIEPVPPQRQRQIVNPLRHGGNPRPWQLFMGGKQTNKQTKTTSFCMTLDKYKKFFMCNVNLNEDYDKLIVYSLLERCWI